MNKIFSFLSGVVILGMLSLAAYITHIVWWINLAMDNQLDTIGEGILAVLGTLMPPIGVLHGLILWF